MVKKILLFVFLILGVFLGVLVFSISSLLLIGYLIPKNIFQFSAMLMEENYFRLMKEESGVELSSYKIIEEDDSHGGFLGDGITRRIYDCRDAKIKISNLKKWKELPLSENLSIEIYGGITIDGKEYPGQDELPQIENGYYYFIDNHSDVEEEGINIHSDENLLKRASQNYILGMYDLDTNKLYYYEQDT